MKGNKIQAFAIGSIVVILGLLSFLYWAGKKEVWFCDEIYTYESANGFEQEWPTSRFAEWMSGAQVERFLSADTDSLSFNAITVRLYCDHVPLYFWIFRLVAFCFFKGSGSIWIGLSINLVFYLCFLVLVYTLLWKATKAPVLSGGMIFLTCVTNRLLIEQFTMLRMYMMLLLVEMLLLATGFWILRAAKDGRIRAGSMLCLYGVSLVGLLTHYHFWVFYAVTAMFFCLKLLWDSVRMGKRQFYKTRTFHNVVAWVGNFVVSLLSTIALFPYCQWNLNRGKGEIALKSVFDFSSDKLTNLIWGFRNISIVILGESLPVWLGLLLLGGSILGVILLLCKRKERDRLIQLVLVLLVALTYQLIVCFTMPAEAEERYLWGTYTLLMLCAAYGVIRMGLVIYERVRDKKVQKNLLLLSGVILMAAILGLEYKTIDGGRGVTFLFDESRDVRVLEEYKEIPWLVYGVSIYSYFDWTIPEKICFLLPQDESEKTLQAIDKLQGQESFVLYAFESNYAEAVEFLERELGVALEGEHITDSTAFSVYLMHAKDK